MFQDSALRSVRGNLETLADTGWSWMVRGGNVGCGHATRPDALRDAWEQGELGE